MNLREMLGAAAAAFDDVSERTEPDGSVGWSREGTVFATLDASGSRVTFRLHPTLATAARRTPDTGADGRGPDWVSFSPTAIDGHAEDRARAWFGAAHRRAGGPP